MRAIAGANNRESSQPASSANRPLEAAITGGSQQVRSLSGSKFSQQLKKQVAVSSQANNIDPLATKQYLQNYLSEHPATQQSSGVNGKMPLKMSKKAQQSNPQLHSVNKQSFSSNSHHQKGTTSDLAEPSTRLRGTSNPSSRHQLNRDPIATSYLHNNSSSGLDENSFGTSTGHELRNERTSSQNKQQMGSDEGLGSVRPSSKTRLSSQQPNLQSQKTSTGNGQQTQALPRGSSPKPGPQNSTPNLKGASQLNLSGQNLQSYFENQIPQFQTGSSKNLPRKKRLFVQGNHNAHQQILKTEPSEVPARQPSRGNLPPMPNSQQRAPSPGAFGNKSDKRPGSRNNRPPAVDNGPQPFQKEELFLNVDSQYNELILQMIQPNRSHFDFEGSIQYVMNASELSNQALAKLLFSRKNIPLPRVPEHLQFKAPSGRERSRNQGGLSSLGRNGAAGQSTASFFNTKKSFLAATHQLAATGLLDNAIKRSDGYHDGPDPQAQLGKDFYQQVRTEVRNGTPEAIKQLMPDYQSAKYSAKRNGIVAAYGANTNQGIVRNYNEDRVAIILNIMKPKSKQFTGSEWPKCSFFGIYDGHGGHVCADFLRDYLHQFIIKDQFFPKEPIKAIKNGFQEAEKLFLEFAEGQQLEIGDIDRSGSCAIVALIIDDMCYIGNTGDSRACMSSDGGRQVVKLSNDHKPTDDIEMHRILNKGGRIYQNASIVNVSQPGGGIQSQIVLGPHRVFPGRLSVCRTFGDIEAKLAKLDGNARVVIADPDVTAFRIERDKHDFIVIGCDGIFDKLENRDCVHLVWQACLMDQTGQDPLSNAADEEQPGNQRQQKTQDERRHRLAGLAVDSILKACAMRRSCDNITAVVIGFDNFYRRLDQAKSGSRAGQLLTSNDFEVIEELDMHPVDDPLLDPGNVIYIESDDHQESQTESQNQEGADELAKVVIDPSFQKMLATKSTDQNSLLYGETGTTQPSGGANNEATGPGGVKLHPLQPGVLAKPDQILSEIAEEDSVSTISDKPRRYKQSDCVTPVEPQSNSLMNQNRDTNTTHSRLKETANRLLSNNDPLTKHQSQGQQPGSNPYTNEERKTPLIGSGTALITLKPSGLTKSKTIGTPIDPLSSEDTQNDSGIASHSSNRPSSTTRQPRSNSGQGHRGQTTTHTGGLHQLIEQNNAQQTRSRQAHGSKNFGIDQSSGISQTVPSINPSGSSAYGNIFGSYLHASNQAPHGSSLSSQQQLPISHNSSYTAPSIMAAPKSNSQTQLAQISAHSLHQTSGVLVNTIQQPALNSQSQQQMPSLLSDQSILVPGQSNSASAPYQATNNSSKARRSSNQSQQRSNYNNSGQSQSQTPMPPPSLVPIGAGQGASSSGISLSNHKGRSSQQSQKSGDNQGKSKAKTQQPNKLVELFRLVDGNSGPTGNTPSVSNQNGSGLQQSHFVQKGSLSGSNQMLMRTMQMNNLTGGGGAQVHNIQIKPISANKRRTGAPQNLIQASFISSGTPVIGQANQTSVTSVSVSNILQQRSTKDKAQFSQTSVLKPGTSEFGSNSGKQAKQPSNKLISQYLAQVNHNSTQQQPAPSVSQSNQNLGAYASRSTRKGGPGQDKQSPGVLSRAQRVQMTYNQSLPQSKTSISQSQNSQGQLLQNAQPQSLSAQGSRQPSSHSNHYLNNQKTSSSSMPGANAYIQPVSLANGGPKKPEAKSRNANSSTAGTHLPKWQSLNTAVGSGVSSSMQTNQTQIYEHSMSMSGNTQQGTKKRKSTNI